MSTQEIDSQLVPKNDEQRELLAKRFEANAKKNEAKAELSRLDAELARQGFPVGVLSQRSW
jgi:hypothetical protein